MGRNTALTEMKSAKLPPSYDSIGACDKSGKSKHFKAAENSRGLKL